MTTKLRYSKIKLITTTLLVLCFVMPFISPIASALIMTYHTHSCYIDEHKYDCDGTNDCCKICQGSYNIKYRASYYFAWRKSSDIYVPVFPSLVSAFRHHIISSVSLVSLKVRLNN